MSDPQKMMNDLGIGNTPELQHVIDSVSSEDLSGIAAVGGGRNALLSDAMKAAKGDKAAARQLIDTIMASPGGPELIEKLGRAIKK